MDPPVYALIYPIKSFQTVTSSVSRHFVPNLAPVALLFAKRRGRESEIFLLKNIGLLLEPKVRTKLNMMFWLGAIYNAVAC